MRPFLWVVVTPISLLFINLGPILLLHFVFPKNEEEEHGSRGTNGQKQPLLLTLKLIKRDSGREVLDNEQIDQICAINCGILQNGSNKPTTK